jgi:hypothetical protein
LAEYSGLTGHETAGYLSKVLPMASFYKKRAIAQCLLLVTLTGLLLAVAPSSPLKASTSRPSKAVSGEHIYGMLLSDSLFLYAPSVLDFDVQTFFGTHPGPLARYVELIDGQLWTAADSVQHNSMSFGVNPQLLLTLMEAQNQVLTDRAATIPQKRDPAAATPAPATFFNHVKWMAQQALLAYDNHRYGASDSQLVFMTGETFFSPEAPNSGTYAVQTILARSMSHRQWREWVQGPRPLFVEQFTHWFGDPLEDNDPMTATTAATPTGYILPFPIGETWYYTGGPHYYGGGTPGCTVGVYCPRPWSALDIAQPELTGCPDGSYPAHRWIVAAKSGNIIQSSQALIVIDHGDGWRTYYSHISSADKRGLGPVNRGDPLGHPSCEVEPGGFTTGIHVHFALYQVGVGFVNLAGHSFSGWVVGETSHYNGTLTLDGAVREASTGRHSGLNDLLNSGVDGFCPVYGGVLLYKHANYDCDGDPIGSGYVMRSSSGYYDLPTSFDNQASSIRIPAGWSVRLYDNPGRRGVSVCRNGDDPSFSGDYFAGGTAPLNDQTSSIEVFDVPDCSGPYQGGEWAATYFDDPTLTNPCAPAAILDGTHVFRDWAAEGPSASCPADNWGVRFSRYAFFPSGNYTFGLSNDDWARLKLNGETVVDNWQGSGQLYGSKTLTAGSYEVSVEYADISGNAYLSAWWWGPGYDMPRESQDPGRWYARYWANKDLSGDPIVFQNESSGSLAHGWNGGGPGYGLPVDRFSGRFERQVVLGCGTYHFQLHTDDGARFWLDDQLVLDAWFDQVGDHDLFVDLETGLHQLRVEHYENGGLAAITLDWTHESFCPLPEKAHLPLINLKYTRD